MALLQPPAAAQHTRRRPDTLLANGCRVRKTGLGADCGLEATGLLGVA
jgi:hypothetical protein